MANPIQQGLKLSSSVATRDGDVPAMANPIQQGLKRGTSMNDMTAVFAPQWLIQYNKD